MKTFSLIASFLFAAVSAAQATIHPVNNNLQGPGIFTTIQAAHDVANAGDTIYVASSPSNYGGATFTKKMTLLGAGMRPGEKKDNSNYSGLNGGIVLGVGSDGSVVAGMLFNGNIIRIQNGVIGGQILRNYFNGGGNHLYFEGPTSGWVIANNFFAPNCSQGINMNNNTTTNIIIQNNVFAEQSGCGFQNGIFPIINFSSAANIIVSNNVFYGLQGAGVGNNDQAFGNCTNFLVENNIFHTMSPGGLGNSVFNNNITFGTAQDALPYGTNSGLNNVSNIDPQMTTFSNGIFIPAQNFQPSAGPAKTGGVSGGQMGVYGGSYNWNNSAVPAIPQIKNFSITSGSTVPAGGSITIKVTSTKQN